MFKSFRRDALQAQLDLEPRLVLVTPCGQLEAYVTGVFDSSLIIALFSIDLLFYHRALLNPSSEITKNFSPSSIERYHQTLGETQFISAPTTQRTTEPTSPPNTALYSTAAAIWPWPQKSERHLFHPGATLWPVQQAPSSPMPSSTPSTCKPGKKEPLTIISHS